MKSGEIWRNKITQKEVEILSVDYEEYVVVTFDDDGGTMHNKERDYVVTFEILEEKSILSYPRFLFVSEFEKVNE